MVWSKRWFAAIGVLTLLLVGCSDTDQSWSAAQSVGSPASVDVEGYVADSAQVQSVSKAMDGGGEEGLGDGSSGAPTTTVPYEESVGEPASDVTSRVRVGVGRDIIYRGSVTVQVDDVAAATREAVWAVESSGGLVFSQRSHSGPVPVTYLTFKTSPDRFSETLDVLAGLGEVRDRQATAEDVTDRVVDFRSRISTAEVSVARLRDLMRAADDVESLTVLERELLVRETELESLRGRLRVLVDQVSWSTIDMTIQPVPDPVLDAGVTLDVWVSDSSEDPCLGDSSVMVGGDVELFFCVQVVNVGDVELSELAVFSEQLRLWEPSSGEDGRWVDGPLVDVLAPGGLVTAVLRVPVEDGRLAGRVLGDGVAAKFAVSAVAAVPGPPLLVAASDTVTVGVESGVSVPGFGGAVSAGWSAVRVVGGYGAAVLGFWLPFSPLFAVVGGLLWWKRRGFGRWSGRVSDDVGE